ncbi:ISL3 family transposase [Deinococcus radiopugnans]|uniref:ISL3 family transposase n=1 Tax=Deinococcus radiopugnans ATCC 19172 TaxID=585398 RepID=A0A5C4Y5Q0_9DEIO|nr:ISL3 family transposase [Deinococcus radiopugnans]TNM70621.1 ISL3 family transposase [Deinococcus radiopugnans ATCC 19172]
MDFSFLPDAWQLLESVQDGEHLILRVQDQSSHRPCPHCQHLSAHVHSHYVRRPQDLALGQRPVTLLVHTRRFRCLNPACDCVTFAERWPDWLEPHAQRTCRLAQRQSQIALRVGGEGGHRLLQLLGEVTSADTLLRLLRRLPLPSFTTPRVLGVDDFCFRRRKTYGTILIDLERHQVVDLLPDREAATLAQWLQDHPGVEVISRDRSGDYARGAASGAPDAQQIADRFHLFGNIREAVETWLRHHRDQLRESPNPVPTSLVSLPERPLARPAAQPRRTTTRGRLRIVVARRAERAQRYEQVARLFAAGHTFSAIAREVGLARSTVTEWLRREGFPRRQTPPSSLTRYAPLIRASMAQREWTVTQIFDALVQQGYEGAFSGVSAYVTWLREGHEPPATADQPGLTPVREKRLGVREVSWLFTLDPDRLTPEMTRRRSLLVDRWPQGQATYALIQQLTSLLRQAPTSGSALLASWIQTALDSSMAEIQRLGRSFKKDFAAICGAIESPWSNGQTEGQVHRLKLIKRQMYGRANLDLLKCRVLLA